MTPRERVRRPATDPAGLVGVRPVLRVTDVDAAAEYYRRQLGFVVLSLEREGREAHQAVLRRGEAEVHFERCSPGEGATGVSPKLRLRFEATDVEAMLADLVRRGAVAEGTPVQDGPGGTRQVTVTDPFGCELTFYQER